MPNALCFCLINILIHETLSVVYGKNGALDICLINKAEDQVKDFC